MKKSWLALTLLPLLAACGGQFGTPTPVTINHLSGNVAGWHNGAGALELYGADPATHTAVLLGTGQIAADGSVVGRLPYPDQIRLYLTPVSGLLETPAEVSCSGSFTASDPSAQLVPVLYFFAEAQGQILGYVQPGGVSRQRGALLHTEAQYLYFADRALQLNGTQTCGSQTVQLNLNLGAGWNVVRLKTDTDSASGTQSLHYVNESALADSWSLTLTQPGTQSLKVQQRSGFFRRP